MERMMSEDEKAGSTPTAPARMSAKTAEQTAYFTDLKARHVPYDPNEGGQVMASDLRERAKRFLERTQVEWDLQDDLERLVAEFATIRAEAESAERERCKQIASDQTQSIYGGKYEKGWNDCARNIAHCIQDPNFPLASVKPKRESK